MKKALELRAAYYEHVKTYNQMFKRYDYMTDDDCWTFRQWLKCSVIADNIINS